MLQYTTLQYTTRHYANCSTPQLQLQWQLHYTNYTTRTTYDYNSPTPQLQLYTPQLQLQLRYTTLHPAVVVKWPLQPLQRLQKTQLQPPFGPSVDSFYHPWVTTTNPSYKFRIVETSATALCGTTGIYTWLSFIIMTCPGLMPPAITSQPVVCRLSVSWH